MSVGVPVDDGFIVLFGERFIGEIVGKLYFVDDCFLEVIG